MIPQIPWYLTVITLATSLAIVAGTWMVLRAGARVSLPLKQRRTVEIGIAVFLVAWLGTLLVLAPPPAFLEHQSQYFVNPLIPFFAAVPPMLALFAVALSTSFRTALKDAPLPAIVGLQAWRVVGVTFLVLMVLGQVPAYFALPAGWGDIFIGVTAPFVALALLRNVRGSKPLTITWTLIGLLDLVVAVGMGTGVLPQFIMPGVEGRLPASGAMGVFPMILVPGFAVPVSALFHVLALVRLSK